MIQASNYSGTIWEVPIEQLVWRDSCFFQQQESFDKIRERVLEGI